MKTIATLFACAAALGLAGAAVAQDNSSMMSSSSSMSGKKMHHSKKMKSKKGSSMSNSSDTGMTGAGAGTSTNGGDMSPTTPSNGMTPQ